MFCLAERKRECEEGNVVRVVGSFNSIVVRRYDEKFSKIKRNRARVVLYVQFVISCWCSEFGAQNSKNYLFIFFTTDIMGHFFFAS